METAIELEAGYSACGERNAQGLPSLCRVGGDPRFGQRDNPFYNVEYAETAYQRALHSLSNARKALASGYATQWGEEQMPVSEKRVADCKEALRKARKARSAFEASHTEEQIDAMETEAHFANASSIVSNCIGWDYARALSKALQNGVLPSEAERAELLSDCRQKAHKYPKLTSSLRRSLTSLSIRFSVGHGPNYQSIATL